MPVTPGPARGKSGCGIAATIGVGVAVLLSLLSCGALYYFFGDRADRPSSSSSSDRPSIGRSGRGVLRDLTGKQIRDRLESLGYSVIGESNSTQQSLTMNQYTVTRTPQSGAVILYKFNDESIAKTTEDSLRNNANASVVRDGNTLLFIMMSPSSASREVLDALVK
jgi:hypothetical protein